ncbi:MAG: TIGR03936 family radical SAM-associated protein [Desulfomonilia bacterium]
MTEDDVRLFSSVIRPGRYIGGEVNQVVKNPSDVRVRFALAFPDVYEIGMSHAGIKILYNILNTIPSVWAQRVFAPWHDMAREMQLRKIPLFSLEEKRPVRDFDVLGFSLLYELSYTSLVRMLKLSGIPVHANERSEKDPIVIAGGTCCVNPLPVLDFIDFVVIGDGEDVVREMASICLETPDRNERIAAMSRIEGVYRPGGTTQPVRRILDDLDRYPFPRSPVVPNISIIHDRVGVEVARGCTRGCRFCQAGMIYRPYRERSFSSVVESYRDGLTSTGYDTLAMLALSMTDLSYLNSLIESIHCPSREVSVGIPSLRVEGITQKVAKIVASVRKPGFTMAPEAATEHLRTVINKGNTEEDLFRSAEIIRDLGWRSMKLYFMVGLPLETDTDVAAIDSLSRALQKIFRGKITISISAFIPKPFTPFQWEGQISMDRHRQILSFLQKHLRQRNLSLKWHEPKLSFLEGVFARGDSRLSEVIEAAETLGAYLDGWGDSFDSHAWEKAFEARGIDPASYLAPRDTGQELPWEFIDMTLDREFLLSERSRAYAGQSTQDCRDAGCTGCGVCGNDLKNIIRGDQEPVLLFTEHPGQCAVSYVLGITKQDEIRFISPREFSEMIKRSLRRAELDVVYSKGFSPIMKLSLTPPTTFGIPSKSEYFQVEFRQEYDPDPLMKRLNAHLPNGAQVFSCRQESLKPVKAYVYVVKKPFRLVVEPDTTILKEGMPLKASDFLVSWDERSLTIAFCQGRTVSPLLILNQCSDGIFGPEDLIKVETIFSPS